MLRSNDADLDRFLKGYAEAFKQVLEFQPETDVEEVFKDEV